MLHTASVPLLPPTGVTHAVSGFFSGTNAPRELLTIAQQHLTLYQTHAAATPPLQYVMESSLVAPPVAVATCRPPNAEFDLIALMFDDTHISFLRWNPRERVFETVALVQLLDAELMEEPCSLPPLLRVDPKGNFIAALVKRNTLVTFSLLGFGAESVQTDEGAISKVSSASKRGGAAAVELNAWGDESEEETEMEKPEAASAPQASAAAPPTPTSKLRVGKITLFALESPEYTQSLGRIRNIRDFQFVVSTGDPLVAVLFEAMPTWAGRVKVLQWGTVNTVENHMLTCSVTWITLANAHTTPKLLHLGDIHALSFTTTHMLPLPDFAGITSSVLCVSAHNVAWVGATRGLGCFINEYGEEESKDLRDPAWTYQPISWIGVKGLRGGTEEDLTRTNLSFANAALIPLLPPAALRNTLSELPLLLITEGEGTVVRLTIGTEAHSVIAITGQLLATGVYCSAAAVLQEETLVYLGSVCSDSRVVDVQQIDKTPLQSFPCISPIRAATPVEDRSGMNLSDEDSDSDLVDETIRNSPYEALYRKIMVTPATPLPSSSTAQDGKEKASPPMDIAVACGTGEAGALCVLRQSVRDVVIPTENLHGTSVFYLGDAASRGGRPGAAGGYLLLTGPDFSLYFAVQSSMEQVHGTVLRSKSKTVFAGGLEWMDAVLQVTEEEIVVASMDTTEEYHSTGLSSLLGKACGAVKSVFIIPSTESCCILFDDGLLVSVSISPKKISSSVVLEGVTVACYWMREDRILAVLETKDLHLLSPNALQRSEAPAAVFYSFALLPCFLEEGREVALPPSRPALEKQPLPVLTHLHVFDHPTSESGEATLVAILSSGELVTYQMVRPDPFGGRRMRKAVHHLLDVTPDVEVIEKITVKRRRLEVERLAKPSDVESESGTVRLVEFHQVHAQCGVYVCGNHPVFLIYDPLRRGLFPSRHRTSHRGGGVVGFSPFHSPSLAGGYVYCAADSSVTFAVPASPSTYLGHGWWVEKTPLGATPHRVLYVPEAQSCIAVTSAPALFTPQRASFDISLLISTDPEGKKTVALRPHQSYPPLLSSGKKPVPLNDLFSLQLVSCSATGKGEGDHNVLDTVTLEPNEKVLCAQSMQLPCNVSADGVSEPLANVFVLGSAFPLGEDIPTIGRLLLFSTRRDGDGVRRLQLVHSEPLKGPVTALTQMDHHIAVAVAGTIRVFKFDWKTKRCETVAMLYAGSYISSLSSFRQYLFFGDLYASVTLAKFSAASRTVTVLGKDLHRFSATQCEAMYHDSAFGLVATDEKRNLVVFGYSPRVSEINGKKTVLESILKVESEFRVPGGSISQLWRLRRREENNLSSSALLYFTNYGEIGCIVPLGALANRTLQNVMKKVQNEIPHLCGLPPQVFLVTSKENPKWDFRADHSVIHAPLLEAVYRLDLRSRKMLALSALTQLDRTLRIGATLFAESWVL